MGRKVKSTMGSIIEICRRIGARLKEERRRMGYTQEQLAERADLSANFIAHLERGSRKPSLDTLTVLSGLLEVPVDRFFQSEPVKPRRDEEQPLVRRLTRLARQADPARVKLVIAVMEEMEPPVRSDRPRRGRRR